MYHNPQHTNNLVYKKILIHNKQVFGKKLIQFIEGKNTLLLEI